jgi:hypothetical protein
MRSLWHAGIGLAVVGLTLAASAWAQNAPVRATPLPPLQQQWEQEGSQPVARGPASPDDAGQGDPGADLQDQAQMPPTIPPVTPPAAVERPNVWVPAGAAKLQALDKVNAQASELMIKVGQSATFGSLTVTVKACLIRPPDQPADATAYLNVTDSHPDSPGFDGWMLADEPSVSMMQNPIYDLRVTGCS